MATADPVRTVSRISSDRSGSCSDDVLSLDSWSEKIEASKDWSQEYESRSRLSSAGGRADRHQLTPRQLSVSEVKKEKSAVLRTGPPHHHSGYRERTATIPTISGNVDLQRRDHGLISPRRRTSSSTSSDSESSPHHSPRRTCADNPQSPSRKIPTTGSHYHGGHHFQFAHHLRPHYQSSPLHRGGAGHATAHAPRRVHSPQYRGQSPRHQIVGHPHYDPSSPYHNRGASYYTNLYPTQNSYTAGNGAALDQILEREGEKLKTKMKSMWNNVKYGEKHEH